MTEAIASDNQTQAATEQVTAGDDTQATESINAGYNRIANPNEVKEEKPQTVETPPEPAFTNEQAKELMAQVARIPDLEKRLRDEGGRYGSLKQSLEQLQQRITASGASGSSGAKADVSKALQGCRDEYGELADLLQPVFEEIAKSGGQIDASTISQLVAEQRNAERQAEIESAKVELTEAHPDWMEVITAPTYQEWRNTLSPRDNARINKSQDSIFAAEMLDRHKDWLKSKTTQNAVVATQASPPSKRLAAAVLPTSGTKVAPKGEPDTKASIRAGYERIAGARMR